MGYKSTKQQEASRVCWEELEAWVRSQVEEWIQSLLEEEVTELLGRSWYARRQGIDGPLGYRNGYHDPRHLTLSCGTVSVRRPRVRGLEERFQSRILPLFARRTQEVGALLPELYLHGLSHGDFELALRGLLGEQAPLSASTVARLKQKWQAEYAEWSLRSLQDLEVVYLWVDGVYVKAGLEKEKAALLVAVAGLSDGRKVLVWPWKPGIGNRRPLGRPYCVRCATGGWRRPVWSSEMGTWGSGPPCVTCSLRPRSSVVGTIGSSMCWTSCRRKPRPRPRSCCGPWHMLRHSRKRSGSSGSSRTGARPRVILLPPRCWTRTGSG